MERRNTRQPRWLRQTALACAALFGWSMVLATPVAALTNAPTPKRPGVRPLSTADMSKIVGSQLGSGHQISDDPQAGPAYAWEASVAGVNTANGNKQTAIPLFGWTARGGMPVALTLYHDSESSHNSELGAKWTHSLDVYGYSAGTVLFHMPDNTQPNFQQDINGNYPDDPIYHDHLAVSTAVGGGRTVTTYTVTTKNQTVYTFTDTADGTTALYCQNIKDTNGNTITFSYTTDHYVSTVTDPTGRTVTFAYADSSNPHKISSITEYAPMLSSSNPAITRVWTMTYNSNHQLVSVNNPLLAGDSTVYKTQISYTTTGSNIATITPPKGSGSGPSGNAYNWTYTYNSDDSCASMTDPASNQTTFTYTVDAMNSSLTYCNVADANNHVTTYGYDTGFLSIVRDPLTVYTYFTWSYPGTGGANLSQITDRNGYAWTWGGYDSAGNPGWSKDPYLNQTTYTWNGHNCLLKVQDPLYSSTDTNTYNHSTTYTYDGSGHDNLIGITDGLGHTTTLTYDSSNNWRLTSVTDPLHTTANTYNHGVEFTAFDANGYPTAMKDGNGHITTTTYDALGRVLTVTAPLGNSGSCSYDTWGRVTASTIAPSSGTITNAPAISFAYDGNSNVTQITDAAGKYSTLTYDYANRVLSVAKANGNTTYYDYDGRRSHTGSIVTTGQKGLLSAKEAGNGLTTTYAYTARNELSGTTYADSTTEGYTYDNNGRLCTHTDANNKTITYAYYHDGLLQAIQYPSGTIGTNTSYTYDNARRMVYRYDTTGQTAYGYDAANRLLQIATPDGNGGNNYVQYTYDNANKRATMFVGATASASNTYTYTYDAGNLLTSIQNPAGETTKFEYTDNNRLSKQTDQWTASSTGMVSTYGYDTIDRLTSILHKTSGGTTRSSYGYTYDATGSRVATRTEPDASTSTYGYDWSGQIISESNDSSTTGYSYTYDYDGNGNRKHKVVGGTGGYTATYSYFTNTDRVYQMTTPSMTKTYGYDSNGNCTSVGVKQSGTTQTTALAYDVENRLTGITYPSASTDTYAYNGNGMRTKKTDSGGTFNYICDGTTPGSDVLSDGAATYTPGISERRNVGGTATSAFYHNDGDGSVGTVTSASQSVTSSKKYDAFGNVVPASGSGSGPFVPAPMTPVYPFGFKGAQQAQTDSSGLILEGDRYYDSDLGRYLSGNYTLGCIGGPDPDPMRMPGDTLDGWIDARDYFQGFINSKDPYVEVETTSELISAVLANGPWNQGFKTPEEAAVAALSWAGWLTERTGWEWGGVITKGSDGLYYPSIPISQKSGEDVIIAGATDDKGNKKPGVIGMYHTHPHGSGWGFSRGDEWFANHFGLYSYVSGANGGILGMKGTGTDMSKQPDETQSHEKAKFNGKDAKKVGDWKTHRVIYHL